MSLALAPERRQNQTALADYAYLERFGQRLRAARMRSGITQAAAARAVNTSTTSYVGWEQGLHAPRLRRIAQIASTLGCTLDELLVDEPAGKPVATVWLSAQTIRDVRAGGRAHALDVAERIARSLEPLIWEASTGRLPRNQDTPARARPRRSRPEVLAGRTAATEARTRARLSYMEGELTRIQAERITDPGGGAE